LSQFNLQKQHEIKIFLGIEPNLREKRILHRILEFVKVDGIIVSCAPLLKSSTAYRRMMMTGIHEYFDFDGIIVLDSGAWAAAQRNLPLTVETVLTMAQQIRPDYFVNLDVTGNPPDEVKSFENFKKLYGRCNIPLIPVIHKPTQEEVFKWYLPFDFPVFGHGGYTPGHVSDTVQLISDLQYFRSLQQKYDFKKLVHIFGFATPKYLAFAHHLSDWIDSANWKIVAFNGAVYCPHCGSTIHVSKDRKVFVHDRKRFEDSSPECQVAIQDYCKSLGLSLDDLCFYSKVIEKNGEENRKIFNGALLYEYKGKSGDLEKLMSSKIEDWTLTKFFKK